jgi:glutaredoxin-related protein
MKNSDYIPEDFDPKEYEEFLTNLGREQMKFLEMEEQDSVACLRRNFMKMESAGVTFNDERKVGYIVHYAMLESEKLWAEFVDNGIQHAVLKLTTVMALLDKGLFEKMDAEDAVLGPRQDGQG